MRPRIVTPGQREAQTSVSLKRKLPRLQPGSAKEGRMCIAGGAPSLPDHLDVIEAADAIMCVNHVHDWLIERGIVPTYAIFYEIVEMARVPMTPHPDVTYLIASQCNESVFEHFRGSNVIMWHANNPATNKEVLTVEPDAVLVAGGVTTGLRGLIIGGILGWRKFSVVGFDSSFEDRSHAYQHLEDDVIEIDFHGALYRTYKIYARQADEFMRFQRENRDVDIEVHGAGLLPAMYRHEFGG